MQIDPTKRTPAVKIEPSFIEIKGECFPEDVTVFAQPIMEELEKVLSLTEEMKVHIELYYFNSSSGKFLFDFFDKLEEAACQGKIININWFYREADKSIKEAGEDFKEDFEEATYKLKKI